MTDTHATPSVQGNDVSSSSRRELLRSRLVRALDAAATVTATGPAVITAVDEEAQFAPFPLLDLQQAYWIGRTSGPMVRTACHGYLEVEVERLDVARLENACNQLVRRHPMLRAVVDADGTQRVLPDVPRYRVPVRDLPGDDPLAALRDVRESMSHQVLPADTWPLFDVRVSRAADGPSWVHVSFDILVADAVSFRVLATELAELYEDPGLSLPPIGLTFRDYVMAQAERYRNERDRAREYWWSVIDTLPPAPDLPLATRPEQLPTARFSRYEARIDAALWRAVREQSGGATATPVLAAFAETLGLWASDPRFTLNLTTFDRRPVHPDVDRLVGPFTGTSLLGIDLARHGSFRELVTAVQRDLWAALEHRAVSGVEVLRELARRRPGDASMPVVFTYVQDPGNDDFRAGIERLGTIRYAISQTPQVLLDCQASEQDDELLLWWDVVAGAFPDGFLEEMFSAFVELVRSLARADAWDTRAPARSPDAVRRIRRSVETRAPLLVAALHDIALRALDGAPERVAVVDDDGDLRSAELAWAARAIARALVSAGIGTGDVVAVHCARGWPQVAAVLGVTAAGAAYLPVDPALPARRASRIAHVAQASAVVVDPEADAPEWFTGDHLVRADLSARDTEEGHLPEVSPEETAYLIFTSGSTGEPKGVHVRHRAAATTILDVNARWGISAEDRVLAVSPLGFDLSVWDVFGVLAAGGTVVTAGPGERAKDPADWLDRMLRHRVTVWNSVPALMGLLTELCELRGVTLPELRLVLLSGDWIPVDLPARIRRVAPGATVVGLGGATEAAVWSVAYETTGPEPGWSSIPYGYPLTNQQLYVLDWAGRERPPHAVGELFIGGDGVADGYWRSEELTARSFPVHPEHGRLYRTGDLVRRHPDGRLEFLGREDNQVKVQGHRIELGEVESALLTVPGVQAAVAAAVGEKDSQRQLVAVVVAADGMTGEDVRSALVDELPSYLVPSRIKTVAALPLTANGKVDRSRLNELDLAGAGGSRPAAGTPSGRVADGTAATEKPSPFEEYLLGALRAWVGDVTLGIHDDLVVAGLDSLDLVRLCNVMERDLAFRPPHEDLVRTPTVDAVRRMLEADLLGRLRSGERLTEPGRQPEAAVVTGATAAHAMQRRRFLASLDGVDLPGKDRSIERRAGDGARWFGTGTMGLPQVGRLLAALDATPRIASGPGEAGPADRLVQPFLHVRTGMVDDLAGGVYHYDAARHRLSLLATGEEDARYVTPPGVPLAEPGAFAVHFVDDRRGTSRAEAAVEAGAMAAVLHERSAELGLCLRAVRPHDDTLLRTSIGVDAEASVVVTLLAGVAATDSGGFEDGEL